MKTLLLPFIIVIGFTSTLAAQENKDKDIWYVWIDTYAHVQGEQKRVVSEEVTVINCCVKSPKYRKLVRSTVKWIRKNVDESYNAENPPLNKVQDKSLAEASLSKIKSSGNVHLVSYSQPCK